MAKTTPRTQDSLPKDGDTKIFSKLLSNERYNPSKHGDASFRVLYYGGGAAGSVPFSWESQPGTPKHSSNDNPPPPLTPPPYYQSNPRPPKTPTLMQEKNSKKTLNSMFTKTHSKKINNVSPHSSSSSSSSSSSFSSSYSLPSTPVRKKIHANNKKVRSDEYEGRSYSPTSTLCLGDRWRKKGYYYPIKSMKKVVMSIVGHGTA